MRKRSKYRPKPIIQNPVAYAIESVTRLADHGEAINLKIKNHFALDELRRGQGTRQDFDVLVAAFNVTEALAKQKLGDDWSEEIRAAQDALYTMGKRALAKDMKFVFTGPEIKAINLGMQIHDSQLDACTIGELEKAIAYVRECLRNKRARPIVEKV